MLLDEPLELGEQVDHIFLGQAHLLARNGLLNLAQRFAVERLGQNLVGLLEGVDAVDEVNV